MPAAHCGLLSTPYSVSSMIPGAFMDAEADALSDLSATNLSLDERALDRLIGYEKSQGQVLEFRPDAELFFDLHAECESDTTRFNNEANAYVNENNSSALAAALAGVSLTPENKALAVAQLANYNVAQRDSLTVPADFLDWSLRQ